MRGRKAVLLVAYHFPPLAISSGLQRTLSFARYLRNHGWQPVVLTATARSYDRTSPAQLGDIPPDVPVIRTFAPDAARHLAWRGRYWSPLALPDRWRAWWLTAVPAALRAVRVHRIDAIWSTYPVATAHAIAASVARRTDVPWVADFRDPMVEYIAETDETFPTEADLRRARLRIEAAAVRAASRLVFCTEPARRITQERYASAPPDRFAVIANGYDEEIFVQAEAISRPAAHSARRVLLHSGLIYRGPDRDPTAFFNALRALVTERRVSAETLEVRLRDPGNEAYFRARVNEFGLQDIVTILPALPYRQALAELLGADALLLLQGVTSNPAVPAKLYEYLRAARPILGLVHAGGATAETLRTMGISTTCDLEDAAGIKGLLNAWLSVPDTFEAQLPRREQVSAFSRSALTAKLAGLLDQALEDHATRLP